jgi:hypothetical protein
MFSSDSFLFRTRVVIASTFVFFLIIFFVLPWQGSRLGEDTGGNPTPDLSFFYSVNDLYSWAESYGEDGRASYIRTRFTFDIVWPLIYTVFLFSSIGGMLYRSGLKDTFVNKLLLVPLGSMIFDYLENVSSSIVMWRYSLRTPIVDYAVTVFTPIKWIILGLSFVAYFYSLFRFIYIQARKRVFS